MNNTEKYGYELPERDIEGGRDDAADIEVINRNTQLTEDILAEHEQGIEENKKGLKDHVKAEVLDHPDGCVTDAKIGNRKILGKGGALQELFDLIGTAIKNIVGKTNWSDAPDISLADTREHVDDAGLHLSESDRESLTSVPKKLDEHIEDTAIHVTEEDKERWNNSSGGDMQKETYDPEGEVEESGGIPEYISQHAGIGDMLKKDFAADDSNDTVKKALTAESATSATTAAVATKLETPRNIRTNLAVTTASSFDGTANINPGVQGILPLANGGTGRNNGIAAGNVVAGTFPSYVIAQDANRNGQYVRNILFRNSSGTSVNSDYMAANRK